MSQELDIIFSSSETKIEEFEFKGKKVKVKVREIGWTEKNKGLSQCFQYQTDGTIKFDFDKYNKEMLKRMVIGITVGDTEVPASELNEIFFARLNSSFGNMLERLVPKAFEEIGISDFFVKGQNNL